MSKVSDIPEQGAESSQQDVSLLVGERLAGSVPHALVAERGVFLSCAVERGTAI